MLSVGELLPAFSLNSVVALDAPDKAFKALNNQSFPQKWLVIFAWPKDFTFVCPTEIAGFGDLDSEFKKCNAQLLGVSTDSEFVHLAWRQHNPMLRDLPFPMMSDMSHAFCSALGILKADAGIAQRATFIVDPEGAIRFASMTDIKVGRNPDEVLRVLQALQTDELVPCSWKPGQKTLS